MLGLTSTMTTTMAQDFFNQVLAAAGPEAPHATTWAAGDTAVVHWIWRGTRSLAVYLDLRRGEVRTARYGAQYPCAFLEVVADGQLDEVVADGICWLVTPGWIED
jgi:hypothetical protein